MKVMLFQQPPKVCPVCSGEKEFKFVINHSNKYDKFSLFECGDCKVQFWTPFKNPGAQWYKESNKYETIDVLKPGIYKDYHKKFLKIFKNIPKGAKILDLGCGTGELIAELQERGCDVWGVDFDKNAIEVAKNQFNLKNVYLESFDDFFQRTDLPLFNIITLFEVLEHLDNPLEFIRNVKKMLKSDGKIILTTPSRQRFLANLASWDFPFHHLTRWNKEAVSNLFKKINFSVSQIFYIGEFKLLMAAFNEKLRLGLTSKVAKASKKQEKINILAKFVRFAASFKEYVIGFIPAIPLWIIGKIIKINQGTMLIELTRNLKEN